MKYAFLFLCLVPVIAFADVTCESVQALGATTVTTDEFLTYFIKSIGGLKGAGALGLVAIFSQFIMKLFQTQLGQKAGKWRLIAIYLLNVIGGIVALMSSGIGFFAALIHSNTLAGLQVLGHQGYKQFIEKKD